MSATGNLQSSVNISIDAMNELIVATNMYRQEVDKAADEIRLICQQMEDDESLKGGDGDLIRENFKAISVSCRGLHDSTKYIAGVLNGKLSHAIKMMEGRTAAASTEAIQQANAKTGVFKK